MSKLEKKILEKGQTIIEEINQSAIDASQALKNKLIDEAKNELLLQLNKEQKKSVDLMKQAEQESARALRDEVAISKQQLIESIFDALKASLKKLKPADHFEYVVKSIKDQPIEKDEEIRVNKHDYEMYRSILSTEKGALIDANLLNDKLGKGYSLKLSQKPAMIESGFILVGKLFDLNFSLENLIESLTKKYEKTIYEALN